MKKILIFSLAYEPLIGGAEIAVKELVERLAQNTFSAEGGPAFSWDMVTLRFSHLHPTEEKIGAVNVHRIGGGKFLFPFRAALKATALHRKNHYNAVWAIMANRAGFAALFFKLFHPRILFILTLQEGDPIPNIMRKVGILYPFFRMIFTHARTVTAISTYLAEWAKKMGAKRVEIIPNGVDVKNFQFSIFNFQKEKFRKKLGYEERDKIIITTSRLVEKNGVGDLIAAMRYLPAHFKLLIIGSGPLLKNYQLLTTNYQLDDRVQFVGEVPHSEIPQYLWSSDIFCRPSLSEGMGNSFIEAMAAGLPVIATPIGGIPDFLKEKETGLFCGMNDPKSIADAVLLLDEQPALREAIIASARRLVAEHYDWDILASKMRD